MDSVDYLVIGAGPAGLQLAHLLHQAGRDYLVLEAGPTPGTFFTAFPRHRQLISINKPHTGSDDPELNLRMDWNSLLSDDPELLFTRYTERYFPSADDLVRYLRDFADAGNLRIRCDSRVTTVLRTSPDPGSPLGGFEVRDHNGVTYRAARLIITTGVSQPYIPDIPGIENAEQYPTVSVDPQDFLDQRVLIIGKGNSAFETADNLMETTSVIHVVGPQPVRLAWRTHFVGHLRAVNNNFLDSYQLKSQNAILDGTVERIVKHQGKYLVTVCFSRANEITKDIPYDRVIACTGFRFDASIFDPSCRPSLVINSRFPDQTSAWESVNVPGMHFAGTLTQMRDFKHSTSGFIHGFRYGVRSLYRILERRHHTGEWPHRTYSADPGVLADAVLERVNRTSALWQQFAILADVITVSGDGTARYYDEVPVDYVRDEPLAESWYTITLEYGPGHDKVDPFDITVGRITQDDAEHSHQGRYLHPVVRLHRDGKPVAEHHITENLENEWTHPKVHREPLRAFLAGSAVPTHL